MSNRTVLALFVKDEEQDIGWWLAWHLAIGFSTIVVYDDGSSDRTRDVVQAASLVYDVRLEQSVKSTRFNHRQKFTYEKAIADAKGHFDWMMILDSDEFLDIAPLGHIDEFIEKFPDADAIAVNWACFGSSKFIAKPPFTSPFDAYIKRAPADEMEANKLVKSLFRLSRTSANYINPHRFDVEGRYMSADGGDMVWDGAHPERTQAYPRWEHAKIRHYACRSLTHFIEKLARRSDIRDSQSPMSYFNMFDRNEIEDRVSPVVSARVWSVMSQIRKAYERKMLSALKVGNFWPSTAADSDFHVVTLHTAHFAQAAIDTKTGSLINQKPEFDSERYARVFGLIVGRDTRVLYLVPEHETDFTVLDDDRIGRIVPFVMEVDEEQTGKVGLRNPHSGRSLCWLPPVGEDAPGEVEANRQWIGSWELVSLQIAAQYPDKLVEIARVIAAFAERGEVDGGRLSEQSRAAIVAFISGRKRHEASRWASQKDVVLPPWLDNAPEITL